MARAWFGRQSTSAIETKSIEFWDDDYGYRATKAHVGTFEIVAIDINHPNWGFYTEHMAFWRSPHMERWQALPVRRDSWEMRKPEDLLEEFPQFAPLFAVERDADY